MAYLTQVSAQDISDQPEFLPIRQKLLAAALQYYQQFIDEHEGDPTIRAELDATLVQVDHILTVLTAQREYTRLMLRALLVGEIAVQKDLRITSEQKEKLLDFAVRVKAQNQQAFQVGLKLSEQERGKQFIDLAAGNEKLLASILTPEQIARLKQIAVQQQGIHAFADAEVAATLALSGEQKLRMRTALDEAALGRKNIYASVRDPGDADHDANELTDRTGRNMLEMLTPAQQEAWRQMTGEPFRSRIGFMPNDSFEFPELPAPGRRPTTGRERLASAGRPARHQAGGAVRRMVRRRTMAPFRPKRKRTDLSPKNPALPRRHFFHSASMPTEANGVCKTSAPFPRGPNYVWHQSLSEPTRLVARRSGPGWRGVLCPRSVRGGTVPHATYDGGAFLPGPAAA